MSTVYRVGEIVKADKYDPAPINTCSHGINVHRIMSDCGQWF